MFLPTRRPTPVSRQPFSGSAQLVDQPIPRTGSTELAFIEPR